MDNKKLWESVLGGIELQISKANFNTWFKDTYINKQEGGTVFLAVPNAFVKDWLFRKFHKNILKLLRDFCPELRSLEYLISRSQDKRETIDDVKIGNSFIPELPLQDFYISKDDNLNPKYTFNTFVVGPFNELAHAAAQAVMKNPGVAYNPLVIYGDTGRGKTHLAQAVGNHIKTHFPSK